MPDVTLEVEIKFPLSQGEFANPCDGDSALQTRLTALGGVALPPVRQIDRYFAHPCRDYAQTDEAFRLRQDGECLVMTYKGPRLDQTTKTRREIELPLVTEESDRDATTPPIDRYTALWTALGFTVAGEVSKMRTPWTLVYQSLMIHAAFDRVDGVGRFVELETFAEPDTLTTRRTILERLAAELGLTDPERRSYLELRLACPA